ncbi:hypothetical protein DIS24_g10694 [Lasiodiplodia hormozganensis]|uniref:BTB domain-containing protein n=1 Tax=Lasiodiplodia hormozganensis TaxID=869390 RepID=A0AA39XPU1_9PEZI|nr:hypothetical protein DIS24_g10694 [Lasiodiplodia hormozganensis]
MDDMPDSDESAAESAPSSPSTQAIQEVVYFDIDGDVRITVHDHNGPRIFIACSKAMGFVCSPWKRMLDGAFREAQAGEGGMKEIWLPDDDPKALTILLNIAHLRFDKLPKEELPFETLRDLIVLSNKYCTTAILKPWIATWTNFFLGSPYFCYRYGQEELLLAREIEVDADGNFVNNQGKVLDPEDDICFYPPGLLDSIIRLRTKTISDMLDLLYGCVIAYQTAYENKEQAGICQAGGNIYRKKSCDALVYGSLMISMQCVGLSLARPSAESVTWSVNTLREKLLQIAIEMLDGGGVEDHTYCNFQSELRRSINKIWRTMPSPVLEDHRMHMQRQRKLIC